ncbi:MAG: pyridoxal-5'-phosphate-dependent protein [Brevundimonas sp. 32-68-21]|jgi:threonine dehydratase|uniref:Threonine/serine dehydratase n=1 Tax=Brevundimonas mediterranea TaxID=74329 RepID=A0AB37E700_9CAUL|nr:MULTISPECIES: threonine/serine dehydratase [Brevundimonas]OYX79366.1 MAG: pyridoxal-5'-phosphate-dependent protein [Brevundimonas sp. 32-68-21]EDX80465.1 Pyridoxal-phosphate dependent enzyme superfamily [Brevundimonas sp. BAL3]MBA4332942.1 threonine/serine dehydratase [Brevundimonas sp.]QIH72765.1 threonine/serine dehydratase [Brevundimonas mediterranea]TAJ45085.1 MAG: threonine/serine dehydratase [Brevundimonas sp.]
MTTHLPSFEGVLDAARQIDGVAVRTPLIESLALNAVVGGRVLMKAENLQRAGAFKFRGAYNRISRLNAEQKARGVVAFSSGNHAQGVAAAAALVGTSAIIVMPSDSPRVKVEGVIGFGGEVRLYDRWTESREAIGAAIAAERGSVLVPPFDDPFIIEGQGTVALEMLDQADAPMDQLLCGASGGGLMAGINLVMAERSPQTKVIVVEPEAYDDTARSLAAGERVGHPQGPPSICDALMSPMPGVLTWPINRRLAGALTVSDAEVAEAVRFAFRHLKLVVEPGGAVSLAALLSGKSETKGRTTGIVLSGGNVDAVLYGEILEGRFEG